MEEPELRPSREARRRAERKAVTRARAVVVELLTLTELDALALPLGEVVERSVREYFAISRKALPARKRLADRMVREVRGSSLDELEAALGLGNSPRSAKDGAMMALEARRSELLEGGDAALDAWVEEHPTADRQQLRQLIRQARKDGGHGRAFKRLFAMLRDTSSG